MNNKNSGDILLATFEVTILLGNMFLEVEANGHEKTVLYYADFKDPSNVVTITTTITYIDYSTINVHRVLQNNSNNLTQSAMPKYQN